MKNIRCGLTMILLLALFSTTEAYSFEVVSAMRTGDLGFDYSTSIATDSMGNTYVTGYLSNALNTGLIQKIDPSGNIVLWARHEASSFTFTSITVSGEGEVYVTGSVDIGADLKVFVMKLNASNGDLIWSTTMGGTGHATGYSIFVDASNNIYVTGYFYGTAEFGNYTLTSTASSNDIFVEKLNASGAVLWAKRMGGTDQDQGYDITVDIAGNTYVTGIFEGTVEFGSCPTCMLTSAGASDVVVEKLDPTGTVLWAKRMGSSDNDYGESIVVNDVGDVYVTGYFYGLADFGIYTLVSEGVADIFIEKISNDDGAVLWATSAGGASGDFGTSIALDRTGNAYVTGYFQDTADFGSCSSCELTSYGDQDIFVAILDNDGDVVWARHMGGVSLDYSSSIALGEQGNAYVTGNFTGNAEFGPFALTAPSGSQDTDIFVFKLENPCSSFLKDGVYGSLLFAPRCTGNSQIQSLLPMAYDTRLVAIHHEDNDAFYISSSARGFSPIVVDDKIEINTIPAFAPDWNDINNRQPGATIPFTVGFPIENFLVPQLSPDITVHLSPNGTETQFSLVDVAEFNYGNTALYLVRDCGIWVDKDQSGAIQLHWVSHAVQVGQEQSDLDVVSGSIQDLHADGNFSHACFLGNYQNTTTFTDTSARPSPSPGDGYYYLVSGTCSAAIGYGNSSAGLRQGLPPAASCP